ncbi:transcription elongation factor GreA [Bacillaceae bacterium SIJ1]|uniref:transcription elongation factor GreA n=1 Tax=Litoribacterium kuwaitense TaxID=1398745 RepID=UPI0013EDD710|nr:transcription elongation factor GreA [Litoribacterium kuwaitense]NGP45669.1 transcription elongation factor GreA [Litoribacterium kuwaitense]
MKKKYPMTREGKQKLEEELQYLKEERRKELDEQIKQARSFCDFSEDVSFGEMVNERSALEARMNVIENMLYNADLITRDKATSVISLGHSVTFVELPNGEEETYTIVGMTEADPAKNKISSESPIAKSLLGHKENDMVSIQTPGDTIKVRIVRVD